MFPPRFIVQKPTLKNFQDLWKTASGTGVPMSRYLFNSVIISLVMIGLTIFLSTITAYALSKKRFRAKETLLNINQVALMFVPVAVMIPKYLVVVRLGLNNSFLAHILPYLATPVGLFLVKQFVDGVPDEVIEAARIDGANDFVILTRIIMPLIAPALATVVILTFQATWGNVEPSSVYIQDETIKSFAFYLSTLTDAESTIAGAGMSAAAALIMFLPNLIIFAFMQSRVMNTMSHSGIK